MECQSAQRCLYHHHDLASPTSQTNPFPNHRSSTFGDIREPVPLQPSFLTTLSLGLPTTKLIFAFPAKTPPPTPASMSNRQLARDMQVEFQARVCPLPSRPTAIPRFVANGPSSSSKQSKLAGKPKKPPKMDFGTASAESPSLREEQSYSPT